MQIWVRRRDLLLHERPYGCVYHLHLAHHGHDLGGLLFILARAINYDYYIIDLMVLHYMRVVVVALAH